MAPGFLDKARATRQKTLGQIRGSRSRWRRSVRSNAPNNPALELPFARSPTCLQREAPALIELGDKVAFARSFFQRLHGQ